MRLTSFVVWKSWASNRLRTALSILGIALGVAVVTAIHVMDHNTIQSRLRQLRPDFGRVDLELVPLDRTIAPDVVRASLDARDDVDEVGLLHAGRVRLAAPAPNDASQPRSLGIVSVFGLSPLPTRAFSHYAVADGDDLSELDADDSVLVSPGIATALGVGVGDELVLAQPRVPVRALCKGGKLVQPSADDVAPGDGESRLESVRVRIKGVLADRFLARRSEGLVVVGSFALARRLAPGERSVFQLKRVYGADPDRMRRELAGAFQVLDERSALLGEAADERAFRNGVKVLGGLALVVGMFIVFQTLSQSLVERLRQIGLLRCLGASRGAVGGIFLADALGMAVVGVTLGLFGGVLLAWIMKLLGFSTLGLGKDWSTFELPVTPLLWTAGLGVVFTLAGAAFPLFKARNLPAMRILSARGLSGGGEDVLRGVNVFLFALLVLLLPFAYLAMTTLLAESARETLVVLGQLAAMILVFGALLLLAPRVVVRVACALVWPLRWAAPLPAFLTTKSMRENPGRFAASVSGLAIVLVALLGLASITEALHGEVDAFGATTLDRRLFVKPDPPITAAQANEVRRIAGVLDVEIHEGEQRVPFILRGVDVASLVDAGGPLAGNDALRAAYDETRSVVVSRRLAHLWDLQPGDDVELLTDEGPVAFSVLAVGDRVGFVPDERAWAVTAPRWMALHWCKPAACVDNVTLTLAHGTDWHAVLAQVRQRFSASKGRWGPDVTGRLSRDVTKDFLLFDVLIAMILGLAGIGLLNAMSIAALARVREIGVLRALGMRRRQLRVAFLIEGAIVGALAGVIADLLGVPLGWMVVEGLNRVSGLQAPFVLPVQELWIAPVLGVAIGVVAAVVPGLRAARMSPAEAVRYE